MAALADTLHKKISELQVYRDSVTPITSGKHIFEACTSIGLRPTQEDRFVLVPRYYNENCSFCGVFDGTVGDEASDYISVNIVDHLSKNFNIANGNINDFFDTTETEVSTAVGTERVSDDIAEKLRNGIRASFHSVDNALISMCGEKKLHYASSTGVTAFLWKNLLTIAHIGDSKACIARVESGEVHPEWLTVDHKPNMPLELRRIEASGGSLAWLHGNKPYIRGGDFLQRQAQGEHPKQLNYSRAFGGKDLKMYGLSADPDISHFEITAEDKLVLLGSDGLWDVLNPRVVCDIALQARAAGRSAATDIVQKVISEMPLCGVRDNITVIAIFLNVYS